MSDDHSYLEPDDRSSDLLYGTWTPSRFEEPAYRSSGINLLDLSEVDSEVKSAMHAWDRRRDKRRGSVAKTSYASSTIERDSKKSSPSGKTSSYLSLAATFSSMFRYFKPKGLPNVKHPSKWLADHVLGFYNEVFLLHGFLSDHCTDEACPVMRAGAHTYLWADGEKVIEPIRCTAPQYACMLFEWIEQKVNDEKIFPIEVGVHFPKDFMHLAKTILKKLFRVYAHLLRSHYHHAVEMGIEDRLSESFASFAHFVLQYKLVKSNQMLPMRALLDAWMGKEASKRRFSMKERTVWDRRMSAPSDAQSKVVNALRRGSFLLANMMTRSRRNSTSKESKGERGSSASANNSVSNFLKMIPRPPSKCESIKNSKPSRLTTRSITPTKFLSMGVRSPSSRSTATDTSRHASTLVIAEKKNSVESPSRILKTRGSSIRSRANSDVSSYRPSPMKLFVVPIRSPAKSPTAKKHPPPI